MKVTSYSFTWRVDESVCTKETKILILNGAAVCFVLFLVMEKLAAHSITVDHFSLD